MDYLPPNVPLIAGQPVKAESQNTGAKISSFAVALLVHALLFALLAYIVMGVIEQDSPELVISSGSVAQDRKLDIKTYTTAHQPKPSPPSQASNLLTSTAMSNVSVPSLDVDVTAPTLGVGDSFGMGFGSGGGGNGGGSGVAFFGSKSTASRVAFIVDVSRSLSDKQFQMIKDELEKSLKKLASSVEYQVLFFSGPAWFAEDDYEEKKRTVVSDGKKVTWSQKSINEFNPSGGGNDAIYRAKWKKATPANLKKTTADIKRVDRSLGTDWRWPLKFALWLNPKPDVIYFLTDGAVTRGDVMVDEVLKVERRVKGPSTKINTIAMMQPRATENLLTLAKKTKGQFTIIHEDGTTEVIKR